VNIFTEYSITMFEYFRYTHYSLVLFGGCPGRNEIHRVFFKQFTDCLDKGSQGNCGEEHRFRRLSPFLHLIPVDLRNYHSGFCVFPPHADVLVNDVMIHANKIMLPFLCKHELVTQRKNLNTTFMLLDCMQRRIRKMDDETKRWLTFDHSPEDKESLLKQVAENEAKNLYNYTISVGSAYYEIENGLIKGSGRSGKGVRT